MELGVYLCANDLLLGRNNLEFPPGILNNDASSKRRLDFMHSIVSSFWKRWQRDYFPTLMVKQKWHVEKRNIRPGDIIIVKDSNTIRGKWKFAQAAKAEKGSYGRVREVQLRYKLCKPGTHYTGKKDKTMNRSVHRLVVLLPVEEM